MKEKHIKNPNLPLLVGLDHNNATLILEAQGVIREYGKKGKTLFIEASPLSANSPNPFSIAIRMATRKGMKVVRLDPLRVGKLKDTLLEENAEVDSWGKKREIGWFNKKYSYAMNQLRERRWVRTLKKQAGGGDIVMAHQNHIAWIQPKLPGFKTGQNTWFVSDLFSLYEETLERFRRLSKSEIRRFRKHRNDKRPINLRKKKR